MNLHPPVVHFPIAFFLLATTAGILYLTWRPRAELRLLTWVPMALGWLGALAAVLTGMLDAGRLPPQPAYQSVLNGHISTGLGQLMVYGWLLYRRQIFHTAKARRARAEAGIEWADLLDDRSARWWIASLLLLGAILVVASGWNGGRLVYEWGVNAGG